MYRLKSYMMVIAISLIFASFFTYLVQLLDGANNVLHNLVKLPFHLSAVIVSIVIFIWLLVRVVEVQTRRDSFSYYKYLYYGFAWSLPFSFLFLLFQNVDILKSTISLIVIWSAITTSLYLLRFIVIDKEKSFLFARNNSPEIVDEEDDKYEFSKTAESIAEMINKLTEPVSVLKLRGDLGAGKSTMVSFIKKRLDVESALITHISLTETNEETDLSKLFTERWFDTLASRYLMISHKINQVGLNSLKSILRDSGNGIFGSIVSVLEVFDLPLQPTKRIGTKNKFISKENAKLFNYIPEITEDLWLIVIDEIERAPYKEILRLIEIIERFKIRQEGGLPIKICFLIVIADIELRDRLANEYEKHDGDIINTFFFKDPKNITHQLWLPPKNYYYSSKHFLDKATALADDFKLDFLNESEMKNIDMHYGYFAMRDNIDNVSFEPSHIEAMSFINHIMLSETPRVINRTIEQCKIFLVAYVTKSEKEYGYDLSRSRLPRYADLLILSYVTIRYSWLIDFFNKTIDDLQPKNNVDYSYLKWSYLKREKGDDKLKKAIQKIVGHEIHDSELKFLSGVFKFAANCYTGLVGHTDDKNIDIALFHSTSYAPNLNEFLSSVAGGLSTNVEKKSFEMLRLHKLGNFDLSMSKNFDLVNHSRFLNKLNLDEKMELLSLEVAGEIVERIRKDKFSHEESGDTSDISESDIATYQFVFLLTKLLAKEGNIADKIKNKCLDLLILILSDSNVQTYTKYLILSSFVNSQRGSGTIHNEMSDAFRVLKEHDKSKIIEIIKSVYSEFRKRYIESNYDIHLKEDNPYYVMYQSWNGNIDDKVGIEELRGIATAYLHKHPEVIRKLWKKYPSEKDFQNMQEYELSKIADNVYLTLDDLIKSTEASGVSKEFTDRITFWQKKKGELKHELTLKAPIERHDTTLRMVLEPYLKDEV